LAALQVKEPALTTAEQTNAAKLLAATQAEAANKTNENSGN
jgi:hypothetical protein